MILKLIYRSIFGSKKNRYESIHTILSIIAIKFGYRMGNKNLYWHKDNEALDAYLGLPNRENKKKRVPERRYVLYSIAKSVSRVSGDIVECGVSRGHSSYLMLKANSKNHKVFYGFDSFEGLSEPGDSDKITNNFSYKWKKNDLSTPISVAEKNLSQFPQRFKLFKGWIPDKFHEVSDKKFCLVHIDVDLYQPTLDSLNFFWDKLNKGGVLVCDDYGSLLCPGAKKAMDEFFESKNMSVIHLTTGQGIVFKR